MDTLDKLIELAQISGSVDTQCRFREKWYVRHLPQRAHAIAHIVTSGQSHIRIAGNGQAHTIRAGDIIFFPRSAEHILSSDPACNNTGDSVLTKQNGAFTLEFSQGQDSKSLDLFCARFEYEPCADIFQNLPETIIVHMAHPALQNLADMLKYESAHPLPGSHSIVNALSTILLALLIRNYLQQETQSAGGILGGWQDKRLRHLIQAVIQTPEDDWNIQKMTETAHLSRAQLMRIFKQQTGTSPHAFVNNIRLQRAALLLRQTSDPILSIALNVGFQSETHFGKYFKKQYGTTPGQYRKNKSGHTEG